MKTLALLLGGLSLITVAHAQTAQEVAAAPAPAGTADAPPINTITVIVENVETDSGTVNVALCDKGLSREGCPYTAEAVAAEAPVTAGVATADVATVADTPPRFVEAHFENIPPGNYAVVSYHDVNDNDEFDKMLGVPREPYALSNGAAEQLVPTFDDAALPIKEGENFVVLKLQRFMGN